MEQISWKKLGDRKYLTARVLKETDNFFFCRFEQMRFLFLSEINIWTLKENW